MFGVFVLGNMVLDYLAEMGQLANTTDVQLALGFVSVGSCDE
jgi:hypothetical protein